MTRGPIIFSEKVKVAMSKAETWWHEKHPGQREAGFSPGAWQLILMLVEKAESQNDQMQSMGGATKEQIFAFLGNPEFLITLTKKPHAEGAYHRALVRKISHNLKCGINSDIFTDAISEADTLHRLFSVAASAIIQPSQKACELS